ncbi:MAG: hypothetical protein K2Q12_01500 [Rickettsiales bacterium]|nr:hypothetical protein [Rickettsiales bacterium]
MQQRGIVIGGVIEPQLTSDGAARFTSHNLSPTLIRTALLYWDKVDIPRNNLVYIRLDNEVENLIKDGLILSTTQTLEDMFEGHSGELRLGGEDLINMSLNHIYKTLIDHNKKEAGLWAFIQQSSEIVIPDGLAVPTRQTIIELYNLLPQPSDSVPLDKIILFREKYISELYSLRFVIERLYKEIGDSKDAAHSFALIKDELTRTLTDIHKAMESSFVTRLLDKFEFKLDVLPIIQSAFGDSGISGAISAGKMFMKVGTSKVPYGLPKSLTPYVYLVRQLKELSN